MRFQLSILTASSTPFGKAVLQKMDIIKPFSNKEDAEQVARILEPHIWDGDLLCVYDINDDDEVIYCNDKSLLEQKETK